MNDILVPNWIKDLAAKDEAKKLKQALTDTQQLLAESRIHADGPNFWKRLLSELTTNTNALGKIGLHGVTSPSGSEHAEQRYKVRVEKIGPISKSTCTELSYSLHDLLIQCRTKEHDIFNLHFCLTPDNRSIGLMPDRELPDLLECDLPPSPFDAEQAAEVIVKRMALKIQGQKGTAGA